MVKVALLVRLEAKPGKEEEVASFLKSGLALVQQEPATIAWFGFLAYALFLIVASVATLMRHRTGSRRT